MDTFKLASNGLRRTAHEYVRESLRSAILRGELPGGARLVQADIARELGVSTTPVREALRDLATEGLVRLDAHRGGLVNQLTLEELHEIQQLMRVIEPEAMRQAAEVADTDLLAEAAEILDLLEQETDPQRWAVLNRDFHASLCAIIPSQRMQAILQGLRDNAAPYLALAIRDHGQHHYTSANTHHREIYEALIARDGERAAVLTRDHIGLTLRAIAESRKSESNEDGTQLLGVS
jgi:DNA-binding GntR family transcriptional regulator